MKEKSFALDSRSRDIQFFCSKTDDVINRLRTKINHISRISRNMLE